MYIMILIRNWMCLGERRLFFRPVYGLRAGLLFLVAIILPVDSSVIAEHLEITICQIQGRNFSSAYIGQTVSVEGVVFLDLDQTAERGFYMQMENCDSDPETSDGIFVYIGEPQEVVETGQKVKASGIVTEYYGMTELSASAVEVLENNLPLPAAMILEPPFENSLAETYMESHEAMRVSLPDARVVGPTDSDGNCWVVSSAHDLVRVFQDDMRGTGEVVCIGDGGLFDVTPQVIVGDQIEGIIGALDDKLGAYCIQLSQGAAVTQNLLLPDIPPPVDHPQAVYRLASFNLANLFDPVDDPNTDDIILSSAEFLRRLGKRAQAIQGPLGAPDLLGIQEVENLEVIEALIARDEISMTYGIVWSDTPDRRGMDLALLYRPERVQVLDQAVYQGCTNLQDGLGPDGNLDMEDPQNEVTCDTDGDGILDGNRLFSRPPMVVRLNLCTVHCHGLVLIVNHWKSKLEDRSYIAYTLPRRIEQSEYIAWLTAELEQEDPSSPLVIMGDLNDFPASYPLEILVQGGYVDTGYYYQPERRYTYNYHGVSQVLDYILIQQPNQYLGIARADTIPINADFPVVFNTVADTFYRSSDHDPIILDIFWGTETIYLPWVARE